MRELFDNNELDQQLTPGIRLNGEYIGGYTNDNLIGDNINEISKLEIFFSIGVAGIIIILCIIIALLDYQTTSLHYQLVNAQRALIIERNLRESVEANCLELRSILEERSEPILRPDPNPQPEPIPRPDPDPQPEPIPRPDPDPQPVPTPEKDESLNPDNQGNAPIGGGKNDDNGPGQFEPKPELVH